MRAANVVIYLFDVNEIDEKILQVVVDNFTKENIQYILVGNKAEANLAAIQERYASFKDCIFISAKANTNIDELKEALIKKAISGDIDSEATIVTNARHYEALQKLSMSLKDVQRGLDDHIPSDLLALDIRQCLHYLGTITGQITNEDQLDFIFSKFCIGK
jgi:tRNA modification GTPase